MSKEQKDSAFQYQSNTGGAEVDMNFEGDYNYERVAVTSPNIRIVEAQFVGTLPFQEHYPSRIVTIIKGHDGDLCEAIYIHTDCIWLEANQLTLWQRIKEVFSPTNIIHGGRFGF